MKNIILMCVALLFSGMVYSQQNNKQLCRVNKIQGKEIYVMSEPVRDYDVIDKVNSAVSQILGVSPTLTNMVNALVDKAVNKEKKEKVKPFDAIITTDGEVALLIKFKEGNLEQKGIGRITKIQGKEVYILNEPLRDYETIDKVNTSVAQAFGVEPTIENMIKTMVDKAVTKEVKGKVGKFDAVLASDSDNAILVKFKE